VTLRPLAVDDAPHFARLLGSDSAAIRMTATIPDPCTEEAARRWLADRLAKEGSHFAILAGPAGEFVGSIGLFPHDEALELGYWVGRAHAGKGYATAAVRLALRHARSMGATRIVAETFPENGASERVLEKAGFARAGSALRDFPMRGGPRESHLFELAIG